jgi:hypothetical protein
MVGTAKCITLNLAIPFCIFILVRISVSPHGCPSFSGNGMNAYISACMNNFLEVEDFHPRLHIEENTI